MTKKKLDELRQRMIHHDVVNDIAVVELSAKELYDLLALADEAMLRRKEDKAYSKLLKSGRLTGTKR